MYVCYKINSKHKIKEEEDDESFCIIPFTGVSLHYNMSHIYRTQDE